jgi:hypothetical protein
VASEKENELLGKKPILNVGKLHGTRAFLIVVSHVIDPCAYGVALHHSSIAGLQEFGRRSHILHPRIEPRIVAIWNPG